MAKDEETDEEEEEEGGGGKKKIIMIVGVLAIGGAAYNFVLKPAPPPEEMADVVEEVEEEIVEGEIFQLEEMVLNLSDEAGQRGFLRIGVAIVLDDLTMAADFEPESPIAKDVAVQYLSSLKQEDLQEPEGRAKAKEELSMLIREAYGDEKVARVLFTALVMQ